LLVWKTFPRHAYPYRKFNSNGVWNTIKRKSGKHKKNRGRLREEENRETIPLSRKKLRGQTGGEERSRTGQRKEWEGVGKTSTSKKRAWDQRRRN